MAIYIHVHALKFARKLQDINLQIPPIIAERISARL